MTVTPLLAHLGADALGVTAAVAIGAVLLLTASLRRQPTRVLLATAVGGLLFQLAHLSEHVVQAAHWVANPTAPPWLGPWAQVGAEALGGLADGQTSTGTELLHLAGNAVFLAGLGAAVVLIRRSGRPPSLLIVALLMQASHVLEHVLLTASWAASGRAVGLSTGFGLLTASTATGVAFRLWFHLVVNVVASGLVVAGLLQAFAREGRHAATPMLHPV